MYVIGDKVMLSTFHWQRDYVQKGQNHVTKFMPRFNGPYTITDAFPLCPVYTIDMPNSPDLYCHFHIALLKPFIPNDKVLFPSHVHLHPDTVITEKWRSGLLTGLLMRENVAGGTNTWCSGLERDLKGNLGCQGQKWRIVRHWMYG